MGKSTRRRISFRQFDVCDDRCAMKVGTDGLLLGAWSDGFPSAQTIIDVGTGSGLVALMLAQRFKNARVIGIELEPKAASQAKENFEQSPFQERLQLVCADFIEWSKTQAELHDMVVCNPPFFRDKPKSPDPSRNLARHDDHLPVERLMEAAHDVTSQAGVLCLVWPTERITDMMTAAQHSGWTETNRLEIKGTPNQPVERMLTQFKKKANGALRVECMAIETQPFEPGKVPENTTEFKSLLRPFMKRFA